MKEIMEVISEAETIADREDIFGSEKHNVTVLSEIKPSSFQFSIDRIVDCLHILRKILLVTESLPTNEEIARKIKVIIEEEEIRAGCDVNVNW